MVPVSTRQRLATRSRAAPRATPCLCGDLSCAPPPECVLGPGTAASGLSAEHAWDLAILGLCRSASQTAHMRTRGSHYAKYPPGCALVHIRRESPLGGVPGERIVVGRRLHSLECARRYVDAKLLIKRESGQCLGPEPLQLGIQGSLVGGLGCGRGRPEQHIEP